MRILAYEHFTARGALAPPDLRTEGGAMLAALATDLAWAGHSVSVLVGPGAAFQRERSVREAGVRVQHWARPVRRQAFRRAAAGVEAVWIVAPETDGCLESLTETALEAGKRVLGSAPAAVAVAASKLRTVRALETAGVPVVPTLAMTEAPPARLSRRGSPKSERLQRVAFGWKFPLVVKPDDGVGCEGVGLVRSRAQLRGLWRRALRHSATVVVQPYVEGVPASASLAANAEAAFPLALQAQSVRAGARFRYRGGEVPLLSHAADEALATARAACEAIPGLAGFVGVDLVLGATGPVVIEVNPRLTTAYLGLRRAVRQNVAAVVLRVLDGEPPGRLRWERQVGFRTSGEVKEQPLPPDVEPAGWNDLRARQ